MQLFLVGRSAHVKTAPTAEERLLRVAISVDEGGVGLPRLLMWPQRAQQREELHRSVERGGASKHHAAPRRREQREQQLGAHRVAPLEVVRLVDDDDAEAGGLHVADQPLLFFSVGDQSVGEDRHQGRDERAVVVRPHQVDVAGQQLGAPGLRSLGV